MLTAVLIDIDGCPALDKDNPYARWAAEGQPEADY